MKFVESVRATAVGEGGTESGNHNVYIVVATSEMVFLAIEGSELGRNERELGKR